MRLYSAQSYSSSAADSNCWWHLTFFFFFFGRRRQIEWHRKWQNYRISLGSFIISQKRGRKQVFISSAIWDSTSSYRAQSRQSDRINVSAQKLLYGNIGWARLVSLRAYCLERVSRQGGIPGNNNNNVAYDKDGGTEIGINHSGCFRGFSFFFSVWNVELMFLLAVTVSSRPPTFP